MFKFVNYVNGYYRHPYPFARRFSVNPRRFTPNSQHTDIQIITASCQNPFAIKPKLQYNQGLITI